MSFNWSNEKTFAGNSNNRGPKLADLVGVVEYPKGEYGSYRFIGDPKGTAMHWLTTLAKPKPGEKKKRFVSFPKLCLGFNPKTMEVDQPEKCPYCSLLEHNPRVELRQNVIDRAIQEEGEPRKAKPRSKFESKRREGLGGKFFFKENKASKSWTPVRVLTVIPAIGQALVELTGLNKITIKGKKQEFGPDHTKYGYDVMVKYDPDEKSPQKIYRTQKGEVLAITEEENEYLLWQLPDHEPENEKAAAKEAKRIKPYLCTREGELLFPDANEEAGSKGKKKNRYKDEFDEDEDMEGDDDADEDDDDDRPRGKKGGKSKSKKSNWDEDDDDDDSDEDDEDEDEEDDEDDRRSSTKRSGKSSKSSKKGGKTPPWEDDEDEDDDSDDEDDEDEEEDERPRKSSKSSKSSGKSSVKSKKIKSKRSSKIKLKSR